MLQRVADERHVTSIASLFAKDLPHKVAENGILAIIIADMRLKWGKR